MTNISLLTVVVVLTKIGSNANTSCNGPNVCNVPNVFNGRNGCNGHINPDLEDDFNSVADGGSDLYIMYALICYRI